MWKCFITPSLRETRETRQCFLYYRDSPFSNTEVAYILGILVLLCEISCSRHSCLAFIKRFYDTNNLPLRDPKQGAHWVLSKLLKVYHYIFLFRLTEAFFWSSPRYASRKLKVCWSYDQPVRIFHVSRKEFSWWNLLHVPHFLRGRFLIFLYLRVGPVISMFRERSCSIMFREVGFLLLSSRQVPIWSCHLIVAFTLKMLSLELCCLHCGSPSFLTKCVARLISPCDCTCCSLLFVWGSHSRNLCYVYIAPV